MRRLAIAERMAGVGARRHSISNRTEWAVHQSETDHLVDSAGRGLVREFGHGRHDSAPGSCSVVIAGERQLVSASRALLKCVVAVALEHELRRPPNIDLRDQSGTVMKSPPGPPMTLGNAANAKVRLIVWCKTCGHQAEPDAAEMAARYSADTPVLDWRERLVCSGCGSRAVDMVVTGTERR